jgi:hypothetical protein
MSAKDINQDKKCPLRDKKILKYFFCVCETFVEYSTEKNRKI